MTTAFWKVDRWCGIGDPSYQLWDRGSVIWVKHGSGIGDRWSTLSTGSQCTFLDLCLQYIQEEGGNWCNRRPPFFNGIFFHIFLCARSSR